MHRFGSTHRRPPRVGIFSIFFFVFCMMFRRSKRVDDITAPLLWFRKEVGKGRLVVYLKMGLECIPIFRSGSPWAWRRESLIYCQRVNRWANLYAPHDGRMVTLFVCFFLHFFAPQAETHIGFEFVSFASCRKLRKLQHEETALWALLLP